MSSVTKYAFSAAAILLGSVAMASAVEFTGGSAQLSFGNLDVDHGGSTDTYNKSAVALDGAVSLSDMVSVVGFVSFDKLDNSGLEVKDRSYGLMPSFAITPQASAGLFYEHHSLDADGDTTGMDVYGIQGTLAATDKVSFTAYYGKAKDKDGLFDFGDLDLYGLRGDVALTPAIGLYAKFQKDSNSDVDLTRTEFGGSYDLSGIAKAPIEISAYYATYGGDMASGYDYKEYAIVGKFFFGGNGTKSVPFADSHSGVMTLY